MIHETELKQDDVWWQAVCSCGWKDVVRYKTRRPASESAQEHLEQECPSEPSDVEIYGAGSV